MQQNDNLQLLISCESQACLESCLAFFRDAGHSVRAHRITSLRDLGDMLHDPQWDLFIAHEKHPEVAPSAALALLAERASDLPCIVRAADPLGAEALAWQRAGARDVVGEDDEARLLLAACREIRARREHRELAALRLQYAEIAERCELLLAASRDAIAYVVDGMHVHANELYAELFGYADVEELGAIPLVDLIAAGKQQEFKDALKRYRADPSAQTAIDFTGTRADGSEFAGQLVLSSASFEGEPCMQVLVRAAVAAPAAPAAPAAGAGGLAALGAALATAAGGQLLLIAVDGFNQHCRNLGVSAANRLVEELGVFIARSVGWAQAPLRAADGVLAVHLPDSDPERALAQARRAVEAVAAHIHEVGTQSVSCGVCIEVCPLGEGRDATVQALLDRCWGALLGTVERAQCLRAADPGRIGLASAGEPAAATAEATTDAPAVEEALRSGKLRILFQPIVSLRGDSSEYYEVQARHQPSDRPALDWLAETSPGASSAELDQLVAQHALQALAAHRATHPETRLILPVGGGSVLDADFADWLAATLRAAAVPPDCVVIAIAHRTASSHLKQAKQLAERLANLGCQLCVSDVHSGNNPIPELLHLRPQFARIAEALAPALGDTDGTNTLLKPLIESLHREQIASIMPRVEGAGVLAVLWQLGVNFIQGDYLQAPQPQMHYDFTDLA
ncbi:MAG: EAL domain-containing protein [Pseudomonadales bacterium]|jgi:PAS domain S-box-containing protein|nr:EAL domain-containing protein [Pseudomonadales bacterium]